MNSLLQYSYISKLFTFKAVAEYLLKMFRKEFRFDETLDEVIKQHRQQYQKVAMFFPLLAE